MTSFKVAQWLREGIAAAKAGDAERARDLLLQVVDADEYNEQAWIWLSSVVDDDADRKVCLENVLSINPDNNLAKAGLAHLQSRRAASAPPPPPQPRPAPPAPAASAPVASDDWWDQPLADGPLPAAQDLMEERLAASVAPAPSPSFEVVEEQAPPIPEREEPQPEPKKRKRRRARRSTQLLAATLCLVLGLLAAAGALMAFLQIGPFDPTTRNYADVMRPLLEDYDAWRDGPYGALVGELNRLCGPGADGWRNQDVLLACSRYDALDCALVAAHCGDDVEAMRERIGALSRQAQSAGATLRAALDEVVPPDDMALAHTRFIACLQARVDDAGRVGEMAQGQLPHDSIPIPACQMFSTAEEEVRGYVGSW
jgi:hypothetical protein